jgi:type I restriction-modification system DNA methylase subunit
VCKNGASLRSRNSAPLRCIKLDTATDPACGSDSLLLKAEKMLGKDAVLDGFYGQEINITTYNLCRINMFLHDIGFDKFDIACEDTLTNPQHWDDEPFELIVSNLPYSIKWEGLSMTTLCTGWLLNFRILIRFCLLFASVICKSVLMLLLPY